CGLARDVSCQAASELLARPVYPLRIRPQILEGVILTRFLIEDMDHDVAIVLHDPTARLIALDAKALFALCVYVVANFVREGVNLASAGAGHDDEKVEDRRDATQVQDEHILGLVGVAGAGALDRLLEGNGCTGGMTGKRCVIVQRTSLRMPRSSPDAIN